MEMAFCCEYEKFKMSHIKRAFKPAALFQDMRTLASGKAFCHVDNTVKAVPKAGGSRGQPICGKHELAFF